MPPEFRRSGTRGIIWSQFKTPKTMKNFAYIHVERLNHMGRGTKATRRYKPRNYTRYWGVQGCWEHDMRLIETANADPDRFVQNTIVCEETDWEPAPLTKETIEKTGCNRPDFVAKKAEAFIKKNHTGDKIRENSVRVCMLLSAVSPQFLRDMSTPKWNEYLTATRMGEDYELSPLNESKVKLWKRATLEYYRNKYDNRLMCVMFHEDELNPHCTAYLVPLIEKQVITRGPRFEDPTKNKKIRTVKTLCAKELFSPDPKIWTRGKKGKRGEWTVFGQGTCSQMQDEYANFLRDNGLDVRRGNRRNPNQPALKHETNRERYKRTLDAIESIQAIPDSELRPFLEAKASEMADATRLRVERDHHQLIAADNQEKSEKLEAKIADLEASIADSMRDLPVAEVIQVITGAEPIVGKKSDSASGANKKSGSQSEKSDGARIEFRLTNGQQIAVNTESNRFENLTPNIPFHGEGSKRKSAAGSINAVMYLTGCSYEMAIGCLATHFDSEAAKRAAAKKCEADMQEAKKRLVEPDESKWPELFAKLRSWKIDENAIQLARSTAEITANSEGQFLFTKKFWNENVEDKQTGSIIVDPMFPCAEAIETGEDGVFGLIQTEAKRTIFCASPLDALAIKSTDEYRDANVFSIGKNPGENTRQTLKLFFGIHPDTVFYAENLLTAGRKITDWIAENFGEVIKLLPLPKGCRDWLSHQINPVSQIQTAPKESFNIGNIN